MTADDLLVGDAEREAVAKALREHCADGRLSIDEFSERLDAAYSARTAGELRRLTGDLPTPVALRVATPAARPRSRGPAALRYVPVALLVPMLWLAGGLFWAAGWHGAAPLHGPGTGHWAMWPIFGLGRLLVLLAVISLIWGRAGRHWAGRR